MNKILFLEVEPEDAARVQEKYPDAIIVESPLTEEIIKKHSDATIVSCMIYSKWDKKTLEQFSNLQLLCTRSVGYDHIDLQACADANIVTCNVPDYGSHVIAEHVFALILSELRHIHEADIRVEQGNFDYSGLRGVALKGKTIGIVGTGKIGTACAHIAHGFGMKILGADMCRNLHLIDTLGLRYTELETLLSTSDIITLHIPALPETKHLINAKSLASMKDGVILVNTARGSLVDTNALLDALNAKKVAYALLDVLEDEKNMEHNKALIAHPNVITTPHIAFYADDSMKNMYDDCFDSIDQWTSGQKPMHTIAKPKIVCDLPKITTQS